MKRFLLISILLIVALSNYAIAQSESEAIITATVENALALVNVDGDWGVLSPGVTYTITPGGYKQPPGPGEGAGIIVGPVGFEVDGNAGSEVFITLVLPSGLQSDDENGNLPCANWTYGWNYDNDPTAILGLNNYLIFPSRRGNIQFAY
ncbi:MAG TPA: hypothetical protein VL633_11420 [Bacteroidota bacterium]|jgi:hypothetical protein|nr:hypothetical protein [Bacteroidota bacterium]